jgi:acylphosphatase
MSTREKLTRRVVVEGFVQGVGYRYFARRAALRLRVSGWVRNRMDGTVEAMLHGEPGDVEAMLAELRRGPGGAEVRDLRLVEGDDSDAAQIEGFAIWPTV